MGNEPQVDSKTKPMRPATPERTCIVTREAGSSADLIRFVVSPDGVVVPDVAHKLPGRGVWVTAERDKVAEAIKSKAFNRACRRQVTVAADLAEQIDQLIERRVVEALSLANKAGLVTSGFTRTEAAILADEVKILLHATDGAEDGAKKLDRLFFAIARDTGRTPIVVRLLNVMQMSLAIGRSNVVHAAVRTGGAADRFIEEARRLVRYRHLPADAIRPSSPRPEGQQGQAQVGPTGNE